MGCSSGFNFNLYKEYIHIKPNSSGREQVHSEMEKCGKHLIQLNYRNFMTGVKVFFAMTNISRKKINDLILIVLLIKYHMGGVSGWAGKVGRWEGGKWEGRKAETRRRATRMGE